MLSRGERLECSYGENAWQAPAALVKTRIDDRLALGCFELLEGAALSYNNLLEVDRQLQTITHIAASLDVAGISGQVMAIGSKHGNACGAAVSPSPQIAIQRMVTGDRRAIFGGSVMLSFDVDTEAAQMLLDYESDSRRLLDVVTAASFTDEATQLLARKHGKCRLLANGALRALDRNCLDGAPRTRYVRGGYLEQPNYAFVLDLDAPAVQLAGSLTEAQARDLLMAWAIGSTSNSNTITLVRDGQLLGNGVGQQDRVVGCALAITRATDAGHTTDGCVAYSDSYFPFPDGPQLLIDAGVSAVFCTTGSVRDDLIRQTFINAGVTLVQLPDQTARGFFGH